MRNTVLRVALGRMRTTALEQASISHLQMAVLMSFPICSLLIETRLCLFTMYNVICISNSKDRLDLGTRFHMHSHSRTQIHRECVFVKHHFIPTRKIMNSFSYYN